MKTYVEVIISTEGEKASVITDIFFEMGFKTTFGQHDFVYNWKKGFKTTFGQHDFVYNWKKKVTLSEILKFVDSVQRKLNGTGALLKFSTIN